MNKNLKDISSYFIDGFVRGAFEVDDARWHIENKLVSIIPKFIKSENGNKIENQKFIEAEERIYEEVNREMRKLIYKALNDEKIN
jgi:hypothetical protein